MSPGSEETKSSVVVMYKKATSSTRRDPIQLTYGLPDISARITLETTQSTSLPSKEERTTRSLKNNNNNNIPNQKFKHHKSRDPGFLYDDNNN